MGTRALRIVLIGGRPGLADRMRDVLASDGCELIAADAPGDADAVLLDLSSHTDDRLAVLARLQDDAPHVPAIVLANSADEPSAQAAIQFGAQDVWTPAVLGSGLTEHLLRTAIARHSLRDELRRQRLFYATIVQSIVEGILLEDASGRITFVNPAAAGMLGYSEDELIGQHWSLIVAREQVAEVSSELSRRPQGVAGRYETTVLTKDGRPVPVIVSARPVLAAGRYSGVMSVFTDISERKRIEEELRTLSLHDSLTGLLNRRGFIMLADQHLRMARRAKRELSLLFADLDGLKAINDSFGHARGDYALMEAAEVLREVFRESDIIARLGGDEFGIVPLEATAAGVINPVQRLRDLLDERNAHPTRPYQLSLSVGIAVFNPHEPCTIDQLLDRADAAMYRHKRMGRQGAA
ncbi:MAG: diguanylate cyclase [Chloroflexi bacterium]|nr:diguanylate cyclase [Chloroflexota bacterium]